MNKVFQFTLLATTAIALSACANFKKDTPTPSSSSQPAQRVVANTPDLSNLNQFERNMVGKVWVTTGAMDQNQKPVAANDQRIQNYLGYTVYAPDRRVVVYNMNQQPKAQGQWAFSTDGKQRRLATQNLATKAVSDVIVETVGMTDTTYVYRVYPDAKKRNRYVDIYNRVVQTNNQGR